MKPAPLVYSIADSDQEEIYQQDSGVVRDVDPDVNMEIDEHAEASGAPRQTE